MEQELILIQFEQKQYNEVWFRKKKLKVWVGWTFMTSSSIMALVHVIKQMTLLGAALAWTSFVQAWTRSGGLSILIQQ